MPFDLSTRTETDIAGKHPAFSHPVPTETLSEALHRITRLACQAMDAPYSSVVLLDGDMYRLGAAEGFPSEMKGKLAHLPRHLVICDEVVRAAELVEIADLRGRPFPETEALVECLRMRSYLGAPIFAGGRAIGAIASFDTRRRTIGEAAQQIMLDLARLVETELRLRQRQGDQRDEVATRRSIERPSPVAPGTYSRRNPVTALPDRNVGILRAIREGVCWLDRDLQIAFANPAAETILLAPTGTLVGKSFDAVVRRHEGEADAVICPIRRSLSDGVERQVRSERFGRGDGSSFQAEYACVPVRDGDRISGIMVIFHDRSSKVDPHALQLKSALQEIQRLQARFLASAPKSAARPVRDYRRWHGLRAVDGHATPRKLAFLPKRSVVDELPERGTELGPRDPARERELLKLRDVLVGNPPQASVEDTVRPRSRIERWSTL